MEMLTYCDMSICRCIYVDTYKLGKRFVIRGRFCFYGVYFPLVDEVDDLVPVSVDCRKCDTCLFPATTSGYNSATCGPGTSSQSFYQGKRLLSCFFLPITGLSWQIILLLSLSMLKTCSCTTSQAKDKANTEIKNLIFNIVLYKLELRSSEETYH